MTRARIAGIERLKKIGFTHNPATGRFQKGDGKARVEVRAGSFIQPSSFGTPYWNPLKDAVAYRLHPGCKFLSPGRYLTVSGDVVDAMGAFRDPNECPECGSLHGEYRFSVRTQNPNPNVPPWVQSFTYCRRCCTTDEINKLRSY